MPLYGNFVNKTGDTMSGNLTLSSPATLTIGAMTQSSILFVGASGLVSQDNTNLHWDDTNNRLGLGTTPSYPLHLVATIPTGPGSLFAVTHNQSNASDTEDSALSLNWNMTAVSATNELVARVLSFGATNNLTGGGVIENMRTFNLALNFNTGTTTSSCVGVWIETGTVDGTVDTLINYLANATHGTTRIGLASTLTGGTNRAHLVLGDSTVSGAYSLYSPDTTQSYFAGNLGIGDTSADAMLDVVKEDAVTNAVTTVAILGHHSTGTPAAGFGGRLEFQLESSTTVERLAAAVDAVWATATDASRAGRLVLSAIDSAGTREGIRVEASGSAALLGFYGATAIAKPAPTGSRGGNAALASLLTALANLGLITDSTSA